ncbi:paeninodin family lasso peptide [Litchfieldia alkalitelluris]|nr:paeninodin family lasso peptide [Litchfieldia alkalitelluris]
MKKEWKSPVLDVLNINSTMASSSWGAYDEGFNENLEHDQQTGPHHS